MRLRMHGVRGALTLDSKPRRAGHDLCATRAKRRTTAGDAARASAIRAHGMGRNGVRSTHPRGHRMCMDERLPVLELLHGHLAGCVLL